MSVPKTGTECIVSFVNLYISLFFSGSRLKSKCFLSKSLAQLYLSMLSCYSKKESIRKRIILNCTSAISNPVLINDFVQLTKSKLSKDLSLVRLKHNMMLCLNLTFTRFFKGCQSLTYCTNVTVLPWFTFFCLSLEV